MLKQPIVPTLVLILSIATSCGRESGADSDNGGFLSWFGPKTAHVVLTPGTTFTVALEHGLSSESNSPGDPVRGRVVGDIHSDGKLVVRDGAEARGVVSAAQSSGRVKGRANLAVKITSIETIDGRKDVTGTLLSGTLVAPGTKKRDAATIAGGTAAGAVLGEIIGDKPGLGAVIGGAAGTGVVLATKGKEVTLPAGTRLKFKLQTPLEADVPIAQAD